MLGGVISTDEKRSYCCTTHNFRVTEIFRIKPLKRYVKFKLCYRRKNHKNHKINTILYTTIEPGGAKNVFQGVYEIPLGLVM